MAEDQQQSGPGVGPLPSAVQGLHGAEANALQLKIKNSICKTVQSKVDCILEDVEKLTDIEKLYLYLKLPSGPSSGNEKIEQSSMSSSRTQQLHAFSWIRNHLEEHPETSLPKQEVYDVYKSYCDSLGYHALSAADFGKIMKNVFPNMKARRLGMRGKSKYCYSGLRKKAFVHMPSLPNLDLHKSSDGCEVFEPTGQLSSAEDEVRMAACWLVCEWAQKVLSRQFDTVEDLARFLLNSHYIGTKSVAALTVMTGSPSGAKMSIQSSAFAPTTDAHSFQPQVKTLVSHFVDAKQQLQRKIQKKQQEQKLHSPLPGEAQARRADVGIAPGAGTGIPCGSPALLSPQPIGIVVAAVSSPITVQRSRQLMSPSPVPMAAADSKVLPVNFQVVTQSMQPVKQCPKTPHNISASPISDRSARHRYAQILPKPSASSGITLRSPTLLITNSPIKTVMSTPHVSSVNVVKMTTISLGSNGSGTSTPADTPASNKSRPASAGIASLNDDPQPVTRVRSGSIAAMPSVLARSGRSTTTTPVIDTKTNTEAIIGSSQEQGGTSRLATSPDAFGGVQWSGKLKPTAASVPTPLDKGSLGLDTLTGTKYNERTLLSVKTLAAGSNKTSNTNESTLYQNTSSSQSNSGNAVVTSPKDAVLASKSPHKRPGLCTDLSPTPVKKAHISVLPAGGSDGLKSNIMAKQIPRSSTPIRPESAPLTAVGKATAGPVRNTGFQTVRRPQSISQGRWEGASSITDYRVPVTSTASQDTSVGNVMFQTVCRARSISQGRWDGSSTGIEGRAVVNRTVSAPGQALLQQVTKNSQDLLIDLSDSSAVCELNSVFWDRELQDGTQQHQVYGPQMVSEPKQMSTSVMEPLPAIAQASPSNQQVQMSDYGTQANLGYFPFNDDDMTQDSIVEELVQMEEQMKINNSMQSFSNCVDNSLQGQQQTMQNTMMSTLQTNTLYYSSAHSSSTPIQTPTPTPTPTSEMIGSGQGLMHESPCSRLAPTTPVDSALGSSRQTPIGTPHSNCSSSVPPSPVECRNPFAFTPINSSITGYHDGSAVSSSPVKPMQRPMATHPDKTKLEWMNSGYNNSGGNSNNGISILPSYQDLVDDHFRKPHAFAIPGQTCQSQTRYHDSHISRLTPISPVQQQVASMASLNKKEGFAVPAPLDNKASTSSSGSGTFRCRSVSPAVRQRNLSGTQAPSVPHSVVSPFNSPITPEVLNIFSNSDSDASISSMAQRSQSVPVTVMMQSEVLPIQAGQQINTKNITNVLINKMDGDGDDSVRGLGINNMPSNYTARMNLTQILETTTVPSFPGSASHQALISPCSSAFESQKPGYLMKNAREEPMSFSVHESQAQSSSGEYQPPQQQQQHLGRWQLLGQDQQSQAMLLPLQQNLLQHQHQQPLDLDRTVKDLLHEESLNAGSQLVGQGSELNAGSSEFPSDMRLTSELTGSINDLNTLDTNLLFDPSQQQGQYEDSTLEELKNDPLFQQICSETVNSAGFDWLESKDQATVEMLG
ncbi:DNA-binding protein RFX7-like [Sinocyclocheilus rhinocerous]|uniref:DNA-binding protein RFX7-like n=1 Tax=Sinocyclocheilus rhinocerous TaxID=307959 RepID=UPI0007B9F725|nr:PREDICTED: DNA-binding protein RFX7-like [Sinocyclocheilus rhinocerous]